MTPSDLAQEAASVARALRTVEEQLDDVLNEVAEQGLTDERAADYQRLMMQYLILVRRDERLLLLKTYFGQAAQWTAEESALFGRLAARWLA